MAGFHTVDLWSFPEDTEESKMGPKPQDSRRLALKP